MGSSFTTQNTPDLNITSYPESNYYNSLPEGYDYWCLTQGNYGQKFWHALRYQKMLGLAQLSPQARVLDIGCGAGNFLAQIPISQKIGIDIAPTQLQFAKESTGADVLMADAGKLPFRAASFDVVFCSEVIEHMPHASAEKMLAEIHRVLKPQGKLILTTPNYASAWKWLEKAGALISKVDFNKAHIAHYTIPLLQQLMHAHQFAVAHTETMLGFSPFVAFSPALAQRCVRWEEKNLGKNGFIILMCAQKN